MVVVVVVVFFLLALLPLLLHAPPLQRELLDLLEQRRRHLEVQHLLVVGNLGLSCCHRRSMMVK